MGCGAVLEATDDTRQGGIVLSGQTMVEMQIGLRI